MKWKNWLHKNRWLPAACLIGVMALGAVPASAIPADGEEISVTMQVNQKEAFINDIQYILDQPPIISGNRALVPLRFFSEALGAQLKWESQNQSIMFENGSKQVLMFVNQRTAYIQNQPQRMDVAPSIIGGRTLVPVRFVSEVLGYDVNWNEKNQTVMITSGTRAAGSLVAIGTDMQEASAERFLSSDMAAKPSVSQTHPETVLEVIRLVNVEREKAGLHPLTSRESLMNTAKVKSQDMVENNYFSHTSPVYGGMSDLLKTHEVTYRYAGENLAMGQKTPEAVVKAWMDSQGHRNNILNPNFTRIGVGSVAGGQYGGYTWTQLFTD